MKKASLRLCGEKETLSTWWRRHGKPERFTWHGIEFEIIDESRCQSGTEAHQERFFHKVMDRTIGAYYPSFQQASLSVSDSKTSLCAAWIGMGRPKTFYSHCRLWEVL